MNETQATTTKDVPAKMNYAEWHEARLRQAAVQTPVEYSFIKGVCFGAADYIKSLAQESAMVRAALAASIALMEHEEICSTCCGRYTCETRNNLVTDWFVAREEAGA